MKRQRDDYVPKPTIVTVAVPNLYPVPKPQLAAVASIDYDFYNCDLEQTIHKPMDVHHIPFASAIILQHEDAAAEFCRMGFADRVFGSEYGTGASLRNALTLATTHGGKTICKLILRYCSDPHLFFTQHKTQAGFVYPDNSEALRPLEIDYVAKMHKKLLDRELLQHTRMPSVMCALVAVYSSNFRVVFDL